MSCNDEFPRFFGLATRDVKHPNGLLPFPYQCDLAGNESCGNCLIRIPTGFGKTLGVLCSWAWNRLQRGDERWPNRLVWCLPMRVLVEQTMAEARKCLEQLGLLWDEQGDHMGKVGVHLLMGGADAGEWHLHPERCAILIGTQDMLLSRALNRGYGSSRARWPMEFGLLSQDCLWVMDEVQLMDVGLATSAQLQAFRHEEAARSHRPCFTWWMSATLQPGWLEKSPDTKAIVTDLPQVRIEPPLRRGHLWEDVRKPCTLRPVRDVKSLTHLVAEEHVAAGRGAVGPTLVVLNTVERAVALAEGLEHERGLHGTEVRLVHSRFRPAERASWATEFLNRQACAPATDRIIVATQVVEAGVDISAAVLVAELSPWASLVQRLGRCARWGGTARVVVVDFDPPDDRAAAPYSKTELDAARQAISSLTDMSSASLESFEEDHPELIPELYPYEPAHLLLRHELDELFDTTPDLSGADIDISRFIRSGDERDVLVFWADVPDREQPSPDLRPSRDGLCTVPFLKARDWLCGPETAKVRAPRLRPGKRAWVWDWLDGTWRRAERRDLYPGQTVLVAAACGGYNQARGWLPESKEPVSPVAPALLAADEKTDAGQDSEAQSESLCWQTIAVHGRETGAESRTISAGLVPELGALLELAGRWHDVGKAHPAFAGSIVGQGRPPRSDLAKAPKEAWLPPAKFYPMPDGTRRPGLRHELASTLALFAVLQRHAPDHPALLGPWRTFLESAGLGTPPDPASDLPPNSIEAEVLSLDAARFDLLAYLVCAHHGKVRLTWHACPADQDSTDGLPRIRGIREGDQLPPITLVTADRVLAELPATRLDLSPSAAGLSPRTGPSWTERALALLDRHGPFSLAWLEALLRAADQRASRCAVPDELLNPESKP